MSSAPVGTSWPLISRDRLRQAPGNRHAARPDADQRELLDAAIALENLVRDARERPRHAVGVHHDGHGDASGGRIA